MHCADNTTEEEDPLLSIDTGSRARSSTWSMTQSDSDDLLLDQEEDETRTRGSKSFQREHNNNNWKKFSFIGFTSSGVWVSHSRLLCFVMVLDAMTLTVQARRFCTLFVTS